MTTAFFEPDKTYRHYDETGNPSEEGLFLVAYVGCAPEPFEHYSETLGVAFGWQQGIGPKGTWEALGSYTTADFAGWREVRPVVSFVVDPDGCRWCGDEQHHHGTQYAEGIGQHQWAQPTDRQRLERMQARRGQRQTARELAVLGIPVIDTRQFLDTVRAIEAGLADPSA